MARRNMITRSMATTVCEVLCVDLTKQATFQKEVKISGTYAYDKVDKLNKDLVKVVNNETTKLVTVLKKREETKIYGMYEDDFIANAFELDENRKQVSTVE